MGMTLSVPDYSVTDYKGLICGFKLQGQALPDSITWSEIEPFISSTASGFETDAICWLHFNLIDTRARNWIEQCDRIPPAAKDLLLGSDLHIRLETVEGTLLGVLGDLQYDFSQDPEGFGTLWIYADTHLVITGRRRPLKTIDQLRRNLNAGTASASSSQFMLQLLQALNLTFGSLIIQLRDTCDRIEDQIMRGRVYFEREKLGQLRRLIVSLRRYLNAQRQALSDLRESPPNGWSETDTAKLQRILDRLVAMLQDLELTQDRARLLQEEMANQLSEATNRNLYILSIVTVIFLPITLITGIFGMNVGGLPWTESTLGFSGVMATMTITIVITIVIFQKVRLF
jgi:zinc transporter